MTTLQTVELGVLGPLQVRQYGLPVAIPGAKPRAILTMLGLHGGSVVSADTLVELLWGDDPPRTAAKALQTHISSLRRTLGDGFVLTEGTGWTLSTTEIDATRYKLSARQGRDAVAAGDTSQAVARFDEALHLWRGTPELPDGSRGVSEKTRWIEGYAALVEDRADALLATGRAAEIIGDLEADIADAPLRERRWGQLMLALYRAGRQGEALGAYQRARSLLAKELGVDPGPDLRRLEAAIVAQDDALEMPVSQQLTAVTRAVTFLLTDIEGSTAAWEADPAAMALALARHDEVVEQVVTSRGGRLIKTRGEGDATFSVFDRPSAAAAAAIELQEAIRHEPWALADPMRIRISLHTGEVELRDGDYFGRAVNRAARLKSLAAGGQILCSGATAELVIDSLRDDVVLADLGMRHLKNLARPEHVFELRLETADETRAVTPDTPIERPALPAVLAGPGPFVGRGLELERLLSAWQTALDGAVHAVLIAGEPGVGKTRLAGEWSRHAYEQGAVVLYGRCDEDLGAPYQPFAEALRSLIPCIGASRLRGLRGVEALLSLVPGLTDVLPDLAAPTRADPDTERYALFDAVVAVLGVASTSAPVVLILDDLHWAAKPTLLLLRHLLRFGEHARVQIVGTYRSTDLDRSHPLAAMLADLHRDGSASRLQLSGLDEVDVSTYVAEAGYDDEELARALASVTGGNPFFLIEALRHVEESGGRWDPSTLPQGVREAVSRRLSRLPAETNKALAAAAVVGSRFALELVERVVGDDLVDAFDEACKAGIVIEEPGGRYRFNHAIVRQSLLAELASVRRMRLHQSIAATLETEPGADDELLADLAHHYFECAWAGNAAKAVDYCRRAADQAMARLAYEGAADLYDRAVHALEEVDEELPDRDDQQAELLVARCEALLAAGDVVSAAGAVSQLQAATRESARLAAWGTCFDGQLSMLTDPERLDEIESALAAAAEKLAGLGDAAGEAKAHTVRAGCLARLGRIGDAETALDHALTAARRAREHRRVNAVLANAPLAALWGPNPVPRAGGRCLDVVRLLRITTGSPVVEATSTRCQAVLDALRGRAAAGRSLLDSARRTLTELGMRHALLEVDQFAGILELIADDPAAAEPHLRRAYNGFRRMGLDADTAETAALLARACLALDRDAEADALCTESEHLAGHALKASIAWRTVRAQLLARAGAHDEARRMAEEAIAVAGRTDLLVDHGDACLALATVLKIAGDGAGARAAFEKAVGLYELKGAAALVETARRVLGERDVPATSAPSETSTAEPDNACARAVRRLDAAVDQESWEEVEKLLAPVIAFESRRKIVGMSRIDLSPSEWVNMARRFPETGVVRIRRHVLAVRGEGLALIRSVLGTADESPGAPEDELLHLMGLDEHGRIALHMSFDIEDLDAAVAELDTAHARLEERHPRVPVENAATQVADQLATHFTARDWNAARQSLADDFSIDDRRRIVNAGIRHGRDRQIEDMRAAAEVGFASAKPVGIAIRGARLALSHARYADSDQIPEAFHGDVLQIVEIDADQRLAAVVVFDLDDIDAAFAELDARYLAGEAAPYADTWSLIAEAYASIRRHELPPAMLDCVGVDHRRVAPFAPGELVAWVHTGSELDQVFGPHMEVVNRLTNRGAVITYAARATSPEGFDAEWREISLSIVDGDLITHCELYEEVDLDAALARFDELSRPAPRLENAASQVAQRYWTHFAAGDLTAMADTLAADLSVDDRRRVVNAGVRLGRDAHIEDVRAAADVGFTNVTSAVIATRGAHLALTRARYKTRDLRPEAFHTEVLHVGEIDAEARFAAVVVFDIDDIDAAFTELDARYLTGEAAAHARTWSLIAQGYAAANRGELAATTPTDELANISTYLEAVHRLTDLGAVVTHVGAGTSKEGFDAEWRMINVIVVDGDLISRSEIFDEVDIDAALARFDQLSRPAPKLENAATRAYERLLAHFATRDWDALAQAMGDECYSDDRRRVVGAGVRHGRDAAVEDCRAIADVGFTNISLTVIATRGERLTLTRAHYSGPDQGPEAFHAESLFLVEIDAAERIAAIVVFELDDIDAAFEELDARYGAGEAAAHSYMWTLIARVFAAINRRELPELTPDWVNIDHRRGIAFEPGDMTAYIRAIWDDTPDVNVYIEAVHRLSDLGAVVTQAATGTSQQGFAAEWRAINISTVDGGLINRCELFDETDIDAAIAKFDELSRPARQLENAASRVFERFQTYFAARDWTAMAEIVADDICNDDRRRVVGAGVLHGRDIDIAHMRAIADVGAKTLTSTFIASRGQRLVLRRVLFSDEDQGPEALQAELLGIVEIDADERIVGRLSFDADDVAGAFDELETRYLAGEAATHAHVWSAIARTYAAANRQQLTGFTPDCVNIDHRRTRAFAPGELTAYMSATWDLAPNVRAYIETVHRLSDLGAVVTHAANGTSRQGFEAEWREINVSTVDADLVNRCELFDEDDIDAALARFDELSRPTPRLENAASQVTERLRTAFGALHWDEIADMLADNISSDDRRRLVSAGIRHGRDAVIAEGRTIHNLGPATIASTVLAIRGTRLVLNQVRFSDTDDRPERFQIDMLNVVEIDADSRIAAYVVFDLENLDAAFEELDARYLSGEAAAHSHTWSVITRLHAAFNRREVPDAKPPELLDHRPLVSIEAGDPTAQIRDMWDFTPDVKVYIEAVHRLGDLGAVFTQASHGTSQAGFDAEWRLVELVTIDGDLANRGELFDEAQIDAALARFDELSRPLPRLENTATQVFTRFQASFAARDWIAMAEVLADDICNDDRRRLVGAGVLDGRDTDIAHMRAIADVGANAIASTVIATRGECLVLMRVRFSGEDQWPEASQVELLGIVEIDADERIVARLSFDPDDFDAAFDELNARYLAGEAAVHARMWSLVARTSAAFNRHELPATTPDWVNIDHRGGATAFAPGDFMAYIRAAFDQIPDLSFRVEAVHRLSNLGAVITQALHGTSQDGFEAEWREINVVTAEGDVFNHSEVFDEADLDAALTRFDELSRPAPRLENAATRVYDRFWTCFAARDWASMAEALAAEIFTDDRRRVVNAGIQHGRDFSIARMRSLAEIGANISWTVIATRGERFFLSRVRWLVRELQHGEFDAEMLSLIEIDADNRIAAAFTFDPEDVDAAFAELDARYLADEAATHSHTWSVMARAYAALNRHGVPATTSDCVNVDHRRGIPFASDDMTEIISSAWEFAPDICYRIEAVHRLSNLGAVVTHAANGTSREGFEAEWRGNVLLTVEGDLINRCEIFDEADLDAALARLDELSRPAPLLVNAASRMDERLKASFAARDWAATQEILAEDTSNDDRRRVVGAGLLHGRELNIADLQAIANVGTTVVTSTVIATRQERLALSRYRFSGRDPRPEAFHTDMLGVVEINADNRIAARVWFDLDDIDAAVEELDARYAAGEAAAHARTWSVIARTYASFNRRELPPTTPDWVNIDHRRATSFAPGDTTAYLRATWDIAPDINIQIEAVHRLSDLGGVVTHVAHGTSQEGFDAEWREITVLTVDGDLINRAEIFDEADIDDALAKFEELNTSTRQLENAASRTHARGVGAFNLRDLDGFLAVHVPDARYDDRRQGLRSDGLVSPDFVHSLLSVAPASFRLEFELVATRGDRIGLFRDTYRDTSEPDRPIVAETLTINEVIDAGLVFRIVTFDPDDIDAALAELDARYLAGEAAAHAHTWSVITGGYAAFNRHELPAIAPDWVNIDHRRAIAFAPGDLTRYIHATWDLAPDTRVYSEAVHRLSNVGAVVTQVGAGTSQQGSEAEWRETVLVTIDGDLINRIELFDEDDIEAALARFDELSRTPLLQNAATRTRARMTDAYNRRDADAFVAPISADGRYEDRRKGLRDEGLTQKAARAVLAAPKSWRCEIEPIALRGTRLALIRERYRDTSEADRSITAEMLTLIEVTDDELMSYIVFFDPDDIDAACEDLDARYLAGEAAAHARTWSVIAGAYAAVNRHELFATTPDCASIDLRRGASFAPGDMIPYLRATLDDAPDFRAYIEDVHRLTDLGAVVTHASHGTSEQGFDAEWRIIFLLTVDGDLINRIELFDEADIDVALARFDELSRPTPQLENAATRVWARLKKAFNRRDVEGCLALSTADGRFEDRRKGLRVVLEGPERRNAVLAVFEEAPSTWRMEVEPIAIRGSRLSLARERYRDTDDADRPITVELLNVTEVSAGDLLHCTVRFDPDKIEAAIGELDARYLAGEAAPHAHTWSVIAQTYAALNRHEVPPTTPNWVNIDHRRGTPFAPGDFSTATTRATSMWEIAPDFRINIEAVHGLSNVGAVVTHAGSGTSREGFDAEWRIIELLTVEGDLISSCELFDEADVDTALARLEELNRQAPKLGNAATRAWTPLVDAYNRHDVDGFLDHITADGRLDDRRKGLRAFHVGSERLRALHALFEAMPESWRTETVPVAIRGSRLALVRQTYRDADEADRPITAEALILTEVSDDGRVRDAVIFDPDDINGAIAELTALWIASGEVAHPEVIEAHTRILQELNSHDWDAWIASLTDVTYVNHRQLGSGETIADFATSVTTVASLIPNVWVEPAEVLNHSASGAVGDLVAKGTSSEGVEVEIPMVLLGLFDGDRLTHFELFDPDQRDVALARFDELNRPA